MNEQQSDQLYDKIFVARQPIFTADMEIWGYELLFRHGENVQAAVITDGDQATTQVIADGFTLGIQGMRNNAKALINFPRNVLIGPAPYVLPADRCVIEILETVQPEPEVMTACQELKDQGYILALDDFVGDPGFEPLCELADIVKVDILNKTPTEVMAIVKGLSRYKALLLAEKVENLDMFKVCKKLGFTYFQGYFFSKPEVIPGRKLSTGQITKVKLLKELSDSNTDIECLVSIIQTDLSISYRLLQYINSARFGFQNKIESIHRAATMLGRQNLRQWLQVIILSDMNGTDKAQELVRISVQRGRTLQLLAADRRTPFSSDGMFLLGFFSVLDAILDQFMEHVLEDIPLETAIKDALINSRSAHAAWIELLDLVDRCNWTELSRVAGQLGLPVSDISLAALDASTWAKEMMAV
jgi:EAL and modified HD-GYP domain-containing signal transduction protein